MRYIVDLFAGLHELVSASASTLLKLASSVRALFKPYGDTLIVTTANFFYLFSAVSLSCRVHEKTRTINENKELRWCVFLY